MRATAPGPQPPAFLDAHQRRRFRELAEIARGRLKPEDAPTLAAYCVVEALMIQAETARRRADDPLLDRGERGGVIVGNYAKIVLRAAAAMHGYLAALGFSPAARARLPFAGRPDDPWPSVPTLAEVERMLANPDS
jgi:P27 family predicted phage terminase small subunit